jgi:carboxyl-terminal processing protease
MLAEACAAPAAAASDDSISAEAAAVTFDAVVRIVGETHFDSAAVGRSWLQRADSLRHEAAGSRTNAKLHHVIRELLLPISGSHLRVVAKQRLGGDVAVQIPVADAGEIGLELRWVDDMLTVSRVRDRGPASRAGVKTGWLVETIDGCAPSGGGPSRFDWTRIAERAMRSLRGPVGTSSTVNFLDHEDRSRTMVLVRDSSPGRLAELPNLPSMRVSVVTARRPRVSGGLVGMLRFNAWHPVIMEDITSALDSLVDADALVLDLRGNTGGVAGMYPWLAGFFLPAQTYLGYFSARAMRQALCAAASVPHRAPDVRPLAILIDGHSHSTTEMFVASLQAVGRARVFGDTSLGGVVGAIYDRLPNGDVLEHPVVDFVTATGGHPEGAGVTPDEVVPLRRVDLIADRDVVMDRATVWLMTQTGQPVVREQAKKCAE